MDLTADALNLVQTYGCYHETMVRQRVLFVTGRLAEKALRRVLDGFARDGGIEPEIAVLPISVASLAHTQWMASRLKVPEGILRVVIPGMCSGDLQALSESHPSGIRFERGPNDLLDLPGHFKQPQVLSDLTRHNLEIIAEINHAPRLGLDELVRQARELMAAGADRIDLGCDPGNSWGGVGDAVRALAGLGIPVSIDSFDPVEVRQATSAGATLVLSVNGQTREQAKDWGAEVVAIPDRPGALDGLAETVEYLEKHGVKHRIDPILEPVGHGFGASLLRYAEMARVYPGKPIMMGTGNVTELAEVDSAGVHLTLLALAREWGVTSVLTTQVANWCRGAVREIDHLRRVVELAVGERRLAKYLDPEVLFLRDRRVAKRSEQDLAELQAAITDSNFRIVAEGGEIHVMNHRTWVRGADPFALMRELAKRESLDASHALYLGYEISKAATALTLGKNYCQDRALNWGFLTRLEDTHRDRPDERGSGSPS